MSFIYNPNSGGGGGTAADVGADSQAFILMAQSATGDLPVKSSATKLNFDAVTSTLMFDNLSGIYADSSSFKNKSPIVSSHAGSISITAASATGAGKNGGAVSITAGSGFSGLGTGGSFTARAGNGTSTREGGNAALFGGDSASGIGGIAYINGGFGSSYATGGGGVSCYGGQGSTVGGDVVIYGGLGPTYGSISLVDSAYNPAFKVSSPGGVAAIGVFNSTPVIKQTVTGSRAGNAALASLLTALSNYGWVVNSSTA